MNLAWLCNAFSPEFRDPMVTLFFVSWIYRRVDVVIVQLVAEDGRSNKFRLSAGWRCIWLRSQCLNLGMIMRNPNNDLLQNLTYELLYPYGSD